MGPHFFENAPIQIQKSSKFEIDLRWSTFSEKHLKAKLVYKFGGLKALLKPRIVHFTTKVCNIN